MLYISNNSLTMSKLQPIMLHQSIVTEVEASLADRVEHQLPPAALWRSLVHLLE